MSPSVPLNYRTAATNIYISKKRRGDVAEVRVRSKLLDYRVEMAKKQHLGRA